MAVKVMSYYWEHSKYSGTDLLIQLALADWCNDEGECYPGIPKLAKKARTGERNAQKIIRRMEADGELRIDFMQGIETGHGYTNRYALLAYQKHIGVNHSSPVNDVVVNSSSPQGVNHSSPKPSVEPSEKEKDSPAPKVAENVQPAKEKESTPASAPKPTKERPRDAFLDAIVRHIIDVDPLLYKKWSFINKLKSQIIEADEKATADDVPLFAQWCRDGGFSPPTSTDKLYNNWLKWRSLPTKQPALRLVQKLPPNFEDLIQANGNFAGGVRETVG